MNRLHLATLFCLCALPLGCGGGNTSSSTSNPLQAVANGASLATATSYWACENCVPGYAINLEFAMDGTFQTIITGNGPASTTCTGTVTYPGNQPVGTEFILGGSCTDGTDSIETFTGISGSTSSGGFSADTTTVSMNQDATYLGCSFSLTQKQGAISRAAR